MKGSAFAKVNLSLRVKPPRSDGFHPIVSLAQSIDWPDRLQGVLGTADSLEVSGAPLSSSRDNLVWQAVDEVRGGTDPGFDLTLEKSIPVAAGLGGGSADAALGLVMAVGLLGQPNEVAVAAAPRLGADVPFCLSGGTAWMEGVGERLTRIVTLDDFWLGLVVPPFELPTPLVYRRWDELDEPIAAGVSGRDLPTSLREHEPLGNDLQAAAIDLNPALGDWIRDLSQSWGSPVLMSGSGPALFGFFATESEAQDAVSVVIGARATRAVHPIGHGWELEPGTGLPPAPWV